MEDWKAEQVAGLDEVIYTTIPSTEIVNPVEEDEIYERKSAKPHTSIPRESVVPQLSNVDNQGEWEEQDAGLRNTTEMAHTLMEKECAAEDVIRVWEEISKYIVLKMMQGQAVCIAGLGTFACRVQKVPVNQKSVKVTKIPVFILSEKVVSMFQLKQDKPLISNVPTTALNLSVIAVETQIPRGMVEGILTEVLQAFARGIICNKSLEFPFPFIGKLYIKDQNVVMKFYNEFCKELGFNTSQTHTQDAISLVENMLHGTRTPLKLHIPTDSFRSVFHLREIRSVHEDSLLVPLVKVDGKYVPKTEACSRDKSVKVAAQGQELEGPRRSNNAPENKLNLRLLKSEPLYKAQQTGDCVLDFMTSSPEVMAEVLRAQMYKVFANTLGTDVVKSHFHRRDNNGPRRQFSYSDVDVEPEYPPVPEIKLDDQNILF